MHVFSSRVINVWNRLPHYVVQAPSTASVKKRLFSFVNSAGAEHVLTFNVLTVTT